MESQKAINVEKLIPSTLLEDERSDVESVSNECENNEQEHNLSEVELKNNLQPAIVSHFYKLYYYNILKNENEIELIKDKFNSLRLNLQSNQNDLNLFPIFLNQKNENYQNKDDIDDINLMKDKYFKNLMVKDLKETNGNGIKDFSRFNFKENKEGENINDENDLLQNNNILDIRNNPSLQNIINNNYITSYNGNNRPNIIFENINNNPLINFQNDFNNNNNCYNNSEKINNINNYNNVNNTNNINNVIFNNNFNNFNISNFDESKLITLIMIVEEIFNQMKMQTNINIMIKIKIVQRQYMIRRRIIRKKTVS